MKIPKNSILLAFAALYAMFCGTGCVSYVDMRNYGTPPEFTAKAADPKPVNVRFVFQTAGSPNQMVTAKLKGAVLETVGKSGLFSTVYESPANDGPVLNVSVNNNVTPDEAVEAVLKGCVTGLTLFIIGSNVRDNYLCTVDFMPDGRTPFVSKSTNGGVYTGIGIIRQHPKNAKKARGMNAAADEMVRLALAELLAELANNPYFTAAPAPEL